MKEGRAQLSCSSAEPTLLCRACVVYRTHLPSTSGGRKGTADKLEEPGATLRCQGPLHRYFSKTPGHGDLRALPGRWGSWPDNPQGPCSLSVHDSDSALPWGSHSLIARQCS